LLTEVAGNVDTGAVIPALPHQGKEELAIVTPSEDVPGAIIGSGSSNPEGNARAPIKILSDASEIIWDEESAIWNRGAILPPTADQGDAVPAAKIPKEELPGTIIGRGASNTQERARATSSAEIFEEPQEVPEITEDRITFIFKKINHLIFEDPETLGLAAHLSGGQKSNMLYYLVGGLTSEPTGPKGKIILENFIANFVEPNGFTFNIKLYSEIRDFLRGNIGETHMRSPEIVIT
jgi:hypothetical protein